MSNQELFHVKTGLQWGGIGWHDKLYDVAKEWQNDANAAVARVTRQDDPIYVEWITPVKDALDSSENVPPYLGTPEAVVALVDSITPITAAFQKSLNDASLHLTDVERSAIHEALAKATKAFTDLAHFDFTKLPKGRSIASEARSQASMAIDFLVELSPTSNIANAGKLGLQASANSEDPSVNVFLLTLKDDAVAVAVLGGNFTDLTDLGVSPKALIAKTKGTGTRLLAWIVANNTMPDSGMTLLSVGRKAAGFYKSLGAEATGTGSLRFSKAALEGIAKKYAGLLENTLPKANRDKA